MIKSQSSPWVFTFLTNALILAFGTFTGILTARLLHPEGRGALAAVLFWPEILAGVGICGLNEALVYRMGQGKESADFGDLRIYGYVAVGWTAAAPGGD